MKNINTSTASVLRACFSSRQRFTFLFAAALCFLAISVFAQTPAKNSASQSNDEKLIDEFIKSKGYDSSILFDSSNIKLFWIDKHVSSSNSAINIALEHDRDLFESNLFPFQLINVDVSQDCKVDVISDNQDLSFSVFNNENKVISKSSAEEAFMDYHTASSTFHFEDTKDFKFYLQFRADTSSVLSIKRIVLSFSKNKNASYLSSPGVLLLQHSDLTPNSAVSAFVNKGKNSFEVTGTQTTLVAKQKILVNDNTFVISAKVKNIGTTPARILLGFVPYSKGGNRFTNRNNSYKNINTTFKVIASEAGSNKVTIDAYPEWSKNCHLALNAKDDLSDFPNFSFVDAMITSIDRINDEKSVITFNKPLSSAIPAGTIARIHAPYGATYLYAKVQLLQPGEEVEVTGTIKKDDTLLEYSTKGFSKGVYYVQPVILSHTVPNNQENTVLISDFKVSY